MRRAFVIFLILLFPLNVFALSMSVASMQQAGVSAHAAVAADALAMPAIGDVDADEPPAGHDFHDSVNEAGRPQPAVLPDRLPPPHSPLRQGLAPVPPIKPPPMH
jgi:hypothetical protein